jgi:hypothetical protein
MPTPAVLAVGGLAAVAAMHIMVVIHIVAQSHPDPTVEKVIPQHPRVQLVILVPVAAHIHHFAALVHALLVLPQAARLVTLAIRAQNRVMPAVAVATMFPRAPVAGKFAINVLLVTPVMVQPQPKLLQPVPTHLVVMVAQVVAPEVITVLTPRSQPNLDAQLVTTHHQILPTVLAFLMVTKLADLLRRHALLVPSPLEETAAPLALLVSIAQRVLACL